jgi:putative ABC transport system substrate-binding protein
MLASELVRRPVDVIVGGDDAIAAAMLATRTIPVVAYSVYTPVDNGYARSLARPGGNLTGVAAAPSGGGHLQKALTLLKELSPRIRTVALVAESREMADSYPSIRPGSAMDVAARNLGIELFFVTFGEARTLPDVVRSAARQGAHALMVDTNYAIEYHRENREALAAEATRLRLPVMHLSLAAAANGALMSYGTDLDDRWRRAAYFVDRILRGERPGDIPIENPPSNVEFHVNRRAARAIGLEIPQSVLLQADRVFD